MTGSELTVPLALLLSASSSAEGLPQVLALLCGGDGILVSLTEAWLDLALSEISSQEL